MSERYYPWMVAFTGLFLLRILGQLIQAIHPLDPLPPFEAWQGGTMPYPLLLAFQIAIAICMVAGLRRVRANAITPVGWKYGLCFLLGYPYFAFMLFRMFAGMTFLADHSWFSKSLPAFFHLVLASYLLTLGFYILGKRNEIRGIRGE